jgi:pyruvate/2-oxoglutarate dehydrogenase complex dihydrolipoamide acyltransferase (E2) component
LESVAEGVLLKQLVPAGETVQTGEILAYVGAAGEAVPVAEDTARREESAVQSPTAQRPVQGPRVSPVVRNLAKKLGVDLANVQGTGQGGIVTRDDVLGASRTGAAKPAAAAGEELSPAQSAVARAVLKSVTDIPHLRIAAEVDMTAAEQLRAAGAAAGTKISYDAIFLRAMAGAIRAVPLVAARLDGRRVIHAAGVHIALAVGEGNQLFLPVVRDVDTKDLNVLQSEIVDLASRARAGVLKPEQMTGGCMTLSNLGMYPIESFDAIIFPEHSAILAVGSVQKRPVVVNDGVAIRPVATVKLAVDHRLINGRTAAEFLSRLKQIVESGGSL